MIFRDDRAGWDIAAVSIALMLAITPLALTFYMAHRGTDPAGPDARWVRGRDMIQFFAGAAVLGSSEPGHPLYDAEVFANAYDILETTPSGRGYGPTYPPPIYQAFDALDGLGQMRATRALLWFFAAANAIGAFLLLRAGGRSLPQGLEVGLLLWCSPTALMGIATGQPSALWLLALSTGLALWSKQREMTAGVALSVLCVKPTLGAPVLLALLLLSQWRVIAGFAAGGLAILVGSILVDGPELWHAYFEMLVRTPDLSQQLFVSLDRHFSFRSLVSVPFASTPLAAPLGALGTLGGIAFAIWIRSRLTVHQVPPLPHSGFAVVLGACAFATPHLLEYDLVLYFPLMVWALYRVAQRRAAHRAIGIATLAAFYLAPVAYPISARIHFSIGSLVALLLLGWCLAEISTSPDEGRSTA